MDTASTALTKIRAGADLVQLYTGFIFKGPGLARDIAHGLLKRMDADGISVIADYRDTELDAWADRSLKP